MVKERKRCAWVKESEPIYIDYHDKEWGVPIFDDQLLFEFLILEGAQAGLSWLTVLKKRENYRRAFYHFDVEKIARFTPRKVEKLLLDPGLIRNQLKINATITNAKAYLQLQKEHGSFSHYLWHFVEGLPIRNHWKKLSEIPAATDISDVLSKDLKKRGFKFVGSTICYAFMQAVGIVNDHTTDCFRYKEVTRQGKIKNF